MDRYPEAACGAAIFNASGQLLLLKRLKEPDAHHWGLPGGKIDFGEPAQEATCREIHEELGIKIEITSLACLTETIDRGDGRHWVAPVYEARIVSGNPDLQEPEKHGGWGWFDITALPHPLTLPTEQFLAARKLGAG